MEDILTGILIVVGIILVIIPSQKFKNRKKFHTLPNRVYWLYIMIWLTGAAMIAAGFLIGNL